MFIFLQKFLHLSLSSYHLQKKKKMIEKETSPTAEELSEKQSLFDYFVFFYTIYKTQLHVLNVGKHHSLSKPKRDESTTTLTHNQQPNTLLRLQPRVYWYDLFRALILFLEKKQKKTHNISDIERSVSLSSFINFSWAIM